MLKRLTLTVIILGFLPSLAAARPEKHFYREKKFLVGIAVIGVSISADMISTRAYQRRCPSCRDFSPFIPQHASTGTLVAVGTGLFAAEATMHSLIYWWSRGQGRSWEIVGETAIPTMSAGGHLYGTINNYQFAAQCRAAQLVCN